MALPPVRESHHGRYCRPTCSPPRVPTCAPTKHHVSTNPLQLECCENWIVPGICNMKVKCGGLCFSAFFWLFGLIAGKWGDRNHDMTVFSQFSSHHISRLFQTLPWLHCLEFPLKCTVFARLQPISSYTPATPN